MGALEKLIEESVKELARPILRYGAQLVSDQQEMRCPDCGSELLVEEHERERTVCASPHPSATERQNPRRDGMRPTVS